MLRATLELLDEVGPDDLTVAAVAARSGVHETTLYRRWRNIDQLVLDALTSLSAQHIDFPDMKSVSEDLLATAERLNGFLQTPIGQVVTRALIGPLKATPTSTERSTEFWMGRLESGNAIYQRAVARGDWPPGKDFTTILETLAARIHFRVSLLNMPFDQQQLRDLISDLLSQPEATDLRRPQ